MEQVVNLNSEQYEEFIRCISILKDICNDIDIRGGMIRQRTNDNSGIFEMSLTSLIDGIDIPLTDLKQKIDLLKCFSGQDEVQICVDDNHFIFKDQYSSIKILSPDLTYLDNKFMTEDELNGIFDINEENLILNYELSTLISDRIRIISQGFSTTVVKISFDDQTASISGTNQSKDQHANFVEGIITNVPMEKSSSNVVITPFIIDHDTEMQIQMFLENGSVTINKFTTTLGDANIVVYTRSPLIGEQTSGSEN